VRLPACFRAIELQQRYNLTVRRARIDRPQMKVLILVPFAAAVVSSIILYEAAERKLTPAQKAAFGVTALVGWILVVVLGNISVSRRCPFQPPEAEMCATRSQAAQLEKLADHTTWPGTGIPRDNR
jgi:hypothetical protein